MTDQTFGILFQKKLGKTNHFLPSFLSKYNGFFMSNKLIIVNNVPVITE
jgi:hypothetical protein